MSQEEEKLIEKHTHLNYCAGCAEEKKEAYHAGKLAGFEEGQRVLSEGIVRPDQSIIHNYFAGWNDALYKAIEKFEEEKKKL